MGAIQTVSARESISSISEILENDGCVVIEKLLDDGDVSQLRRDLETAFAKTVPCRGDFFGNNTKRVSGLFTKAAMFQKLALDPVITGVMDRFLLGDFCSQYQINLTQGIAIEKIADDGRVQRQVPHQDDGLWPCVLPGGQEKMINCMWAVSDFTAENGATLLVPGSHRWPRDEQALDQHQMQIVHQEVPGVMKAGSVLIYFGSLYHAGGENITDEPRLGAVISYCLGWLRQTENSYLAYSPDDVRQMDPALQKLLGYFVHAPNLGAVDGHDPMDVLHGRGDHHFDEFLPPSIAPLIQQHRQGKQADLQNPSP